MYIICMQKFEDFIESGTSKRPCTLELRLLNILCTRIHFILLKWITSGVNFHTRLSHLQSSASQFYNLYKFLELI